MTWLQIPLNAHPEISCCGEGHFPNRLPPIFAKVLKAYNLAINAKNRSIFAQLDGQSLFTNRHNFYFVTTAISLMLCQPDKALAGRILGDKTPDNVRYFALLATLFPHAKFIPVVCDARDCAVSAWYHNCVNPARFAKSFASRRDYHRFSVIGR